MLIEGVQVDLGVIAVINVEARMVKKLYPQDGTAIEDAGKIRKRAAGLACLDPSQSPFLSG